MEEQEKRLEALNALPPEEMKKLDDSALREAMSYRNDKKVTALYGEPHKRKKSLADCYAGLDEPSRTYAMADLFALGMEVGGLCENLTGDLRNYADELPEILLSVGAGEIAELLEKFYTDNNIDPKNMADFEIKNTLESDYPAQEAKYPYAEFNRRYAELPPLADAMANYARRHIESL